VSEHRARVVWVKETESFDYQDYNRGHSWTFPKGGATVRASAAPKFRGTPDAIDPEEALVAALSSCHMLTFLAICSRRGIVVERYDDDAVGWLEPNEDRKLALTRVVLRPRVGFAADTEPAPEVVAEIHEQSHKECFIANSVRTRVTVEASVSGGKR
jgi:organic hydroperoxide reductase OsmC/OhrA